MKFRHNAILKDDPLAGVVDPEKKNDGAGVRVDEGEMTMIEHMHNHRRLSARQIQLLAIAGTIGECNGRYTVFSRLLFRCVCLSSTLREKIVEERPHPR